MLSRTFRPPHPVDLALTLRPVCRGRGDPCMRIGADGVWRATRTPDGAATTRLTSAAAVGEITVAAWGPGAAWAIEHAPELVGATDGDDDFEPHHPLVRELHRRLPGLRIPRTRAVVEALVPTILEQKVTGGAARRSYQRLVRRGGEPAPGPPGLRLPPDPAWLARLPTWVFHQLNIEERRADTIRRACGYAPRLEEIVTLDHALAARRLMALPGIGPWSAAEVAVVALGDADAVSVGDYHLPHTVAWLLAGETRGDDNRMLELLEPYRGHRARVVKLLEASGSVAPRFGPRLAPQDISAI